MAIPVIVTKGMLRRLLADEQARSRELRERITELERQLWAVKHPPKGAA